MILRLIQPAHRVSFRLVVGLGLGFCLMAVAGCRSSEMEERKRDEIRTVIRKLLDEQRLQDVVVETITLQPSETDDCRGNVSLIDQRQRRYDLDFRGRRADGRWRISMALPRLRHLEVQAQQTLQQALDRESDLGWRVRDLVLRRDGARPEMYFGMAEIQTDDSQEDRVRVDLEVLDESQFQMAWERLHVPDLLENLRERMQSELAAVEAPADRVELGALEYLGNARLRVWGTAEGASGQRRFQTELQWLGGGQVQLQWEWIEAPPETPPR